MTNITILLGLSIDAFMLKRKITFIAAFLLLFILGFMFVLGIRVWQPKSANPSPVDVQRSDFFLQPPLQALTANVEHISGEVKKRGREDTEFQLLNVPATLVQGESLQTGKDGLITLVFSNFGKIQVESSSKVGLVNLLPDQFLVSQTAGTVVYNLVSDKSLSVRSFHLLITEFSGSMRIHVQEEGRVTIDQISGIVKLAYVDTDNKTQVLELSGGKVIFDDATRTVN